MKVELTDQVREFVTGASALSDTEAAAKLAEILGKEVKKSAYAAVRKQCGFKRKAGRPRKVALATPVEAAPAPVVDPAPAPAIEAAPAPAVDPVTGW